MRNLLSLLLVLSSSAASAKELRRESFENAVRRALELNPSLAIARQEVERARALVQTVRSAALPTLSGNATYTRLDADRVLQDRVIAGADSINANLTLTVPLISPSRWVAWKNSADNLNVAKLSAADVRRQLALNCARLYLAILAQKRVVEANLSARDTAKAHYDFSHGRLVGGVGNKLDEVRAAQELATFESQLRSAEAQLIRTREALGVVLAYDEPVDSADEPMPWSKPISVGEALGDAERLRSDVKAAREKHKASSRYARWGWTDFLPIVTGTFQPFYQNPPSLVQPQFGWQAQLILALPIYDGGLRYGAQRDRKALSKEAASQLEATLRQARSDVRTALEAVRLTGDALVSAENASQLTHQALELANIAYRAGSTTNLELIDAQRRAHDADTARAIAEDAVRQTRLELLAATGHFPD